MSRLFAFLAAVVVSSVAISSACSADVADSVHFSLQPAERDDGIHASFRKAGQGIDQWSADLPARELVGLDISRFRASGSTPVRFALVREAGRLDCAGNGGNATAAGTCRFSPNASFMDFLVSRGMRRPTSNQALGLMAVDARRGTVEALGAARYPVPTVDQLTGLTAVGVDAPYIAGLSRVGYRPQTIDTLLEFRALNITPEFIQGFVRLGYADLPASEFVQLKALGIDADFVAGFERIGYGRLPASDLVQLKSLGVTPAWVASFERLGYHRIGIDDLVQMKALGVTPDYALAVRKSEGAALPSPDRLIQLRAVGFRPRLRN